MEVDSHHNWWQTPWQLENTRKQVSLPLPSYVRLWRMRFLSDASWQIPQLSKKQEERFIELYDYERFWYLGFFQNTSGQTLHLLIDTIVKKLKGNNFMAIVRQ